jgi:hypothetical protein
MAVKATSSRPARPVLVLALLAAAGVLVLATLLWGMRGLALGGLAGWLLLLSLTVGAAVWLLIGALTGGRWLAAAAPVLAPLSGVTWLVALLGVLLVPLVPVLYPWWGQGAAPVAWFAPFSFAVRAVLVLVLWAAIGLLAPRALSPLVAGMLLTLHGLAVSVAGVDWVLALDPEFVSTAFGAHLGVLQLGLALALVALLLPRGGDIGGLMLACVLGVFYLGGMGYLVSWSGNLPHKAAWYLARQEGGGLALLWLSFAVGILGPFAVLLTARARRNALALRVAGVLMLAGGLLHLVWLVAPGNFGAATLIASVIVLGAGALWRIRGGGHA